MNIHRSTVIGGAGFIGTTLVQELVKLGHHVSVIDDLSSGRRDFIPSAVDFYHCDIARLDKLAQSSLAESDFVFLLAAQFANDLSTKAPLSDALTGSIGVLNVYSILERSNRLKKLVYTSSSCVYGNSAKFMSEDDRLHPSETPYAIHKYLGELYADYYYRFKNVPAVSLRIFNTYGPFEVYGPNRNVTARFIQSALLGEDLIVTGSGDETRDYTYVGDTVRLIIALSDPKLTMNYRVVNGGTGVSTRTVDLAAKIIDLSGSKSKIVFGERRPWDLVTSRVSDISRARNITGHSPNTSLDLGLAMTIDWYRNWLEKNMRC